MENEKIIMDYINQLTYPEFQNINIFYQLGIDEPQLKIVYDIIKNNMYALIHSDYHTILYNYIQQKTSINTCLKVKKLISEYHFYFNPVLNV